MRRQRQAERLDEVTVDAESDAQTVVERLDVDVRRPVAQRLADDLRDELDDGGLVVEADLRHRLGDRLLAVFAGERRDEVVERVLRARSWLGGVEPESTEETVMKLLGLRWTGAPEDQLDDVAGRLLAQQNRDGGWSQVPERESDAYASGQAVVALELADRLPMSARTRARDFLLDTQYADGSWLGLMATSSTDKSILIPPGDAETARAFGQRIATAVARWGPNPEEPAR